MLRQGCLVFIQAYVGHGGILTYMHAIKASRSTLKKRRQVVQRMLAGEREVRTGRLTCDFNCYPQEKNPTGRTKSATLPRLNELSHPRVYGQMGGIGII